MSKKRNSLKMKNLEVDEDIGDIDINAISDSEDDYTEAERNLLEKVRTGPTTENYESEDEVYGLQDEDEDEDMENDKGSSMGSDIEGLEEDYDLPNERAWGKKKKAYYSTDYVDPDYASASQRDLDNAEIEEKEARSIQKRLAEQLDDADFGLEFVQDTDVTKEVEDDQIIKTDLSKLSKRQKQVLLQKQNPEFMALVNDFKERMSEAKDILEPFLKLVKNGVCPECPAVTFVKTKYELILNYCINVSFYLMLKAKKLSVNSHPVIKRLAQYRQLLTQLQSGEGTLLQQISEILEAQKAGFPLYDTESNFILNASQQQGRRSILKQKLKATNQHILETEKEETELLDNTNDEIQMDDSKGTDTEMHEEDSENEGETQNTEYTADDGDGKRAITYQIAKNRGLTPHRKKDQRNPRVKHRNKYRKAKIRRKGAVREVRKELHRYAGEISGIKAGVKKSIKLK